MQLQRRISWPVALQLSCLAAHHCSRSNRKLEPLLIAQRKKEQASPQPKRGVARVKRNQESKAIIKAMPPRKKRATAAAQPKESSPLKKAVIEAITCPITRQLVVDPVVAEDGNTYESAAIKQWLNTNRRSPMTNEMMGDRLTASRKTRDLVQRGVRSLHFVRRRPCDRVGSMAWRASYEPAG